MKTTYTETIDCVTEITNFINTYMIGIYAINYKTSCLSKQLFGLAYLSLSSGISFRTLIEKTTCDTVHNLFSGSFYEFSKMAY